MFTCGFSGTWAYFDFRYPLREGAKPFLRNLWNCNGCDAFDASGNQCIAAWTGVAMVGNRAQAHVRSVHERVASLLRSSRKRHDLCMSATGLLGTTRPKRQPSGPVMMQPTRGLESKYLKLPDAS
jgi:hypothetical protein